MRAPEPDPAKRSHGADRLLAQKERVMGLWVERVRREVPAAEREAHPVLINTLPVILDQLVEALSPHHPRVTATQGSTSATEHGGERVRVTHFRLEDLIKEYSILRQVLFELLEAEGPLTAEERGTVNTSLDQALMEACTGYALVQSSFRDQLFAIVAHDLRNPLNAAQASANLIVHQPSAADVPQWAARVIANIGRVDRMVKDLLDATRVQTGARLPLELEECDLVESVRDTLDHLRVEHGDRFVLEAPDAVRGHFATDSLRRAVENLATNAVRHGASGRPIRVSVRQTHGRAILTVHNEGAHIPTEEQETLFRAFQRTTQADRSGKVGWGLGLAQVRAAAEAHGGSIGVDSQPDRGTRFTIDIPVDARPFQGKPITPLTGGST